MTAHMLDERSVINPETGRPWPLWAGDTPQEPDPHCACGAEWIEDQCAARNTFYGAQFELSEATRALFAGVVSALRLDRLVGWLARQLRR